MRTPLKHVEQDGKIKMQKNTGALYTKEGQVIVAVYDPKTGDAWFNDQSRGIAGYTKITPDLDAYTAWDDIWHAYSYHKYSSANTYRGDNGEREVSYWSRTENTHHVAEINLIDRLED